MPVISLKARLARLEMTRLRNRVRPPYVVYQENGESIEEAEQRALAGRAPTGAGNFIVVPSPLSLEEWESKYSPGD